MSILPRQIYKLTKNELAFPRFRSEILALLFGALNVRHFLEVGILYSFCKFSRKQKYIWGRNIYTTFINSSWGIFGRKMREVNFSSMCHIFVIPRGLWGHSLLMCAIFILQWISSSHIVTCVCRKPPLKTAFSFPGHLLPGGFSSLLLSRAQNAVQSIVHGQHCFSIYLQTPRLSTLIALSKVISNLLYVMLQDILQSIYPSENQVPVNAYENSIVIPCIVRIINDRKLTCATLMK